MLSRGGRRAAVKTRVGVQVVRLLETLTETLLEAKLWLQIASILFDLSPPLKFLSHLRSLGNWALHPRVSNQITQPHAQLWLWA